MSESEARPVKGQSVPNFELPDQNGDPFLLGEKLSSGPLVLVFYRGDW